MAKGPFQITHDFPAAVALGLVKGVEPMNFFGSSSSIPGDVTGDLSATGQDDVPLPANGGEALELVSDSALDAALVTVRISALGPLGIIIPEFDVVLNGTTAVGLPGLISRVNSARCISDGGFVGAISIQSAGGAGAVFGVMTAVGQRLVSGATTVPAGWTGVLKTMLGTMQRTQGGTTTAVFTLAIKAMTQDTFGVVFGFGVQRDGDTSIEFNNPYPGKIVGPADIKLRATPDTGSMALAARIGGVRFDAGMISG